MYKKYFIKNPKADSEEVFFYTWEAKYQNSNLDMRGEGGVLILATSSSVNMEHFIISRKMREGFSVRISWY